MASPLSSPSTSPIVSAANTAPADTVPGVPATFAEAINARFPVPALVPLSPALPPATSSFSSHDVGSSSFAALSPSALHNVLADGTLVLDIRPHNAYSQGRLPNAISLSVPSTLLKRPGFSLAKLAQMLPSPAARHNFTEWHNAERILVYDADSAVLTEGGNVLGLLRKFRHEGYTRDVAFVKGGFHAVWREMPSLIDSQPPPREDEDDGLPAMSKSASAPAEAPTLRTKHLPMSAFTLSSTVAAASSSQPSLSLSQRRTMHLHSLSQSQPHSEVPPSYLHPTQVIPSTPMTGGANPFSTMAPPLSAVHRLPPMKENVAATAFPLYPDPTSAPTLSPQLGLHARPHYNSLPAAPAVAFNPFFDNVRQNLELRGVDAGFSGTSSNGAIPLKLPRRVRRRVGDLPFEWLRQIARKSGKVKITSASDAENEMSATGEDSAVTDVPALPITTGSNSDTTSPSNSSAEDLTHALASQFHRIELSEQKRLMGVMEHHSKESGAILPSAKSGLSRIGQSVSASSRPTIVSTSAVGGTGVARSVSYSGPVSGSTTAFHRDRGVDALAPSLLALNGKQGREAEGDEIVVPEFPYSITAGIEKGTKNRYRNIWPFEHARVRLMRKLSNGEDDDYMNASYVQPVGTTKRYIATQGPLPATFNDFWSLCWEQNVHVIVMLTREVEGAAVKCGHYWADGSYGPLKLKLLETTDTPERERERRQSEMASGFFNLSAPPKPKPGKARPKHKDKGSLFDDRGEDQETPPHTIRRVFSLTHSGYPFVPARTVIQFQYLEWPDMNVPDEPRSLLRLVREIGIAAASSMQEGDKMWGEGPMSKEDVAKYRDGILSVSRRTGSSVVPSVISEDVEHSATEPDGKEKTHDGGVGPEDNADLDASSGEMDPKTGIAKHALRNPPVLLHCSAGVGRTGGFIAVDAVLDGIRREMRKRSEGRARAGVSESDPVSSGSGSQSPLGVGSSSPPRGTSDSRSITGGMAEGEGDAEPMEIDSSASPSPPRVQASPSPGLVAHTEVEGGAQVAAPQIPTGLTLPMAAGRNEVHVPVAGFSVPMDVDPSSIVTGLAPPPVGPTLLAEAVRPGLPRKSTVTASPELVSEVKRATMLNRMLSAASKHHPHGHTHSHPPHPNSHLNTATGSSRLGPYMEIRSPVPHVASPQSTLSSRALSEVSADCNSHGTLNSRRSMVSVTQSGSGTGSMSLGTGSGLGTASGLSCASPTSISTTSLLISARTAGLSLGDKNGDLKLQEVKQGQSGLLPSSENTQSRETLATGTSSAASSPDADLASVHASLLKKSTDALTLGSTPSRLDDWRSEVRNSQSQDDPSARLSGSDETESSDPSVSSLSKSRVMAQPRRLHDDASPPMLSTYDEPIRRLVEDMRQQRMSLCQSLRQYVFVHRAIIEGALMIVDDEREKRREEFESSSLDSDTEIKRASASSSVGSFSPAEETPACAPSHASFALGRMAAGSGLGAAFVLRDDALASKSVTVRHPDSTPSAATSPAAASVSPGRSKRGASPTELLKEGTTGEVLLTKRPSIKRRQRSSDEEEQVLRAKHVHTTSHSPSHLAQPPRSR